MNCLNCGAKLRPGAKFCLTCGAPRPQVPPQFAEAKRRLAVLRTRYQAGELDSAAFDAELQKLVVRDESGGYWTLTPGSGEWYWYDGSQWVRQEPPLVSAPPPATSPAWSAPPPAVAPPLPAALPAKEELPWKWIGLGCGGLLVVGIAVAILLAVAGALLR
jgi:hypothetical protein